MTRPSGSRDHPRVRGEQARRPDATAEELGPSPRARGADLPWIGGPAVRGIIPACAEGAAKITA